MESLRNPMSYDCIRVRKSRIKPAPSCLCLSSDSEKGAGTACSTQASFLLMASAPLVPSLPSTHELHGGPARPGVEASRGFSPHLYPPRDLSFPAAPHTQIQCLLHSPLLHLEAVPAPDQHPKMVELGLCAGSASFSSFQTPAEAPINPSPKWPRGNLHLLLRLPDL